MRDRFEEWLEERKKKKVVAKYLYKESDATKSTYKKRTEERGKRNRKIRNLVIGTAVLALVFTALTGLGATLLVRGLASAAIFLYDLAQFGKVCSSANKIRKYNNELAESITNEVIRDFIASDPDKVEELMREKNRESRGGQAVSANPQPQIQQQAQQQPIASTQTQQQQTQQQPAASTQTQQQQTQQQPAASTQTQQQQTQQSTSNTQYFDPHVAVFPELGVLGQYENHGFGPQEYTTMCKNLNCHMQNINPQSSMVISRQGSDAINSAGHRAFVNVSTGPVQPEQTVVSAGKSR